MNKYLCPFYFLQGVTSLALLVCVFCIVMCLSSLQFPLVFVAATKCPSVIGYRLHFPSPVHLRPSISVQDWLPSPLPRLQRTTLHQSPVCPSTFKPGPVYCSVVSSSVCVYRLSCMCLCHCHLPLPILVLLSVKCYTLLTTCLFV